MFFFIFKKWGNKKLLIQYSEVHNNTSNFCGTENKRRRDLLVKSNFFLRFSNFLGMPSSGLVWYINGKMSPEIWIQRGLTYSIYVHGGNNPHSAEYYNPFIITDEPHGGYERLNEQAQKQVKVLAGVQFTLRGQPRPIAGTVEILIEIPACGEYDV